MLDFIVVRLIVDRLIIHDYAAIIGEMHTVCKKKPVTAEMIFFERSSFCFVFGIYRRFQNVAEKCQYTAFTLHSRRR